MTRSASISRLGSEFDDFLFASIGEGRNEIPLSVLSALTRLNVDPWEEAAKLARLPVDVATDRLASLFASLPDEPSAHLESGAIAARLIALLPGPAGSNVPLRETSLGVGEVTNSRAATYIIFINVIFFSFLLTAQLIAESRQPPAEVINAHAPATTTASP